VIRIKYLDFQLPRERREKEILYALKTIFILKQVQDMIFVLIVAVQCEDNYFTDEVYIHEQSLAALIDWNEKNKHDKKVFWR
jgi:hypothetical protein